MFKIIKASAKDAEAILSLQKLAYQSEVKLYNDPSLPAMTQTCESLLDEFSSSIILKGCINHQIIASVRAKVVGDSCEIGRLIVHPSHQGKGIGTKLLKDVESMHPTVKRFELFTGSKSLLNIKLYKRNGYKITGTKPLSERVSITYLEKTNL